jgi:hypothetical protein
MWCVVAAYGGERYLHQVAVPLCIQGAGFVLQKWHPILCLIAICAFAVYLFILRRNKKKYYGEVYVKQIINMSGMGEWGGSWGGVFGYDLLKEVRYICNEYAVLGDKICC